MRSDSRQWVKNAVITFARIKTKSISCLSVFSGSTQYTFLIKSKVCFVRKEKTKNIKDGEEG